MHVKIQKSGKGGNTGSCGNYAEYLDKENKGKKEEEKEHFFSAEKDNVKKYEVIAEIDHNKKKLCKDEAKFYSVTFSPSKEELKHIGNDKEKMKAFTREAMDEYAKNFNKGLEGKDLLYYAKIEQERKYRGTDKAVKLGKEKQGARKPGEQTHVHVIVSRRAKNNGAKVSPLANTRNKKVNFNGKEIQKGFDREKYVKQVEKTFDKKFDYNRKLEDKFEYKLAEKKFNKSEEKKRAAAEPQQPKAIKRAEEKTLTALEQARDQQRKREIKRELSQDKNKNKGRGLSM